MKICSVGAELFHADRRTDGQADMTKLIVAFRNFAKATKSGSVSYKKIQPVTPREYSILVLIMVIYCENLTKKYIEKCRSFTVKGRRYRPVRSETQTSCFARNAPAAEYWRIQAYNIAARNRI